MKKILLLIAMLNLFQQMNLNAQGITCATATSIAIGSCTDTTQTISDATIEGTTPAPSCIGAGVFRTEGWYSFTAVGPLNLSIAASSITGTSNLIIEILSGTCGSALTEIDCVNQFTVNAAQTEIACISVAAAGTYYVRIVNAGSIAASMNISNLCINVSPPNDGCPGTTLTPSASCTVGTPTSGTVAGACQTFPGAGCTTLVNTPIQDVWYSFVAMSTSQVITVVPSLSLNPAFQVFSTSCGGTSINCTDANGTGITETNTLVGLTIGNTYWVRVYSANAGIPTTGTFTINIETPPSNDDCINVIPLTPASTCTPTAGCDYLATNSGITPCGTSNADDDVWYSFVATGISNTIQVTGSASFDPAFSVFSGACGGLTSIGCMAPGGSPGSTQTLCVATVPGTQYYISVYDYNTGYPATNTFTICIIDNCGTVGVDELNQNGVSIYPNPTTGQFTISSTTKIESIKVFNVIGCEILKQVQNDESAIINLSDIPKGIYFVEIKTGKGVENKKVIIQ